MKRNKKVNKTVFSLGFTLIEVLIVVAIIGILASVVLVGLGPLQRQGRDARRISDLKQVQTGLELYYNKNGSYPQGVDVSDPGNPAGWQAFQAELTGAGIGVSNVPKDPSSGKNYLYQTDAGGSTYVLGAVLDDVGNSALEGDIDSNPLGGFDCGDPVYCVQL